jgi:hypothetical protein
MRTRLERQQSTFHRGGVVFVACAIVAQSSCTTAPKPVDFATAKTAYSKSDYRTALKGFTVAAQHDNPEAQLLLAKMYEDGQGVQQSYSEAFNWYQRAAAGNAR